MTIAWIDTLMARRNGTHHMPYRSLSELPDSVKDNLPRKAQRIYRKAFNNAYHQHEDEKDVDKRASNIAWGAVKREYHKEGGDRVKDKD